MANITELRYQKSYVSPEECMKGICEHIGEIKRVVNEAKKQLTKEEKAEVRAYRHAMMERIQATHELHLEREASGRHVTWNPTVFEKWNTISRSIPSDYTFK